MIETILINGKEKLYHCTICGTHSRQTKQMCRPCWKSFREEIIARDGCCAYCGEDYFHVLLPHHLVDYSRPDYNHPHNIITSCWNCHTITHHKGLTDDEKIEAYLRLRAFKM